MLIEEFRPEINNLQAKLAEMRTSLDIEVKEDRIAELEHKMGDPTFWDDPDKAQKIAQDVNALKEEVEGFHGLSADVDDLEALWEMANEEKDEELVPEMEELLAKSKETLDHLELGMLLSGEYDANNAIITLHAGAGGTEAQDWTSMLYRMFTRFAEQNGFTVEVLDFLPGDEAGVKSATFQVNGHNAYGFMKSEKGVHRLVRISPFDANARRHTSFAAVDVMPELDDTVEVNLNMADVRVDTYRASGAGGQHVNKTSSAVRMTHEPTGIVVSCQQERSQIQNREKCLQMLRAKLWEYEKAKQDALVSDIAGDYQNIEWGSQIRSYVFQPYTMVKDHRTSCETGNIGAVMDGDLMKFVEAYLRSQQRKI
ncbi:MAG: peptide chain release factor 2 [Phascolarctobacterium sp.]|nr:peptide chain release factor 2 [Phascolarctobacterium sp.]